VNWILKDCLEVFTTKMIALSVSVELSLKRTNDRFFQMTKNYENKNVLNSSNLAIYVLRNFEIVKIETHTTLLLFWKTSYFCLIVI
jgi:hypothetical protein